MHPTNDKVKELNENINKTKEEAKVIKEKTNKLLIKVTEESLQSLLTRQLSELTAFWSKQFECARKQMFQH